MAVRLALFYAAVFLFVGVSLPFWPVWLSAKGLSATEIGLLITAGSWIRIAAPALAAHVADRRGRRRGVLILLAVSSFAVHLLFLVSEGFAALLAVSILAAIAFTPIIPMGENMTLLASRERGFDYGRVRLWGSIAFIVGATAGGRMVGDSGSDVILWLVLGTLALTVLASLAMPETGSPPARRRVPAAALLSQPSMAVFLVTASLIQASHAAAYGFATLAWRDAGIDDDVIGLLWAEGVLAEIVLFALGGGLAARLGPARLLAIAGRGNCSMDRVRHRARAGAAGLPPGAARAHLRRGASGSHAVYRPLGPAGALGERPGALFRGGDGARNGRRHDPGRRALRRCRGRRVLRHGGDVGVRSPGGAGAGPDYAERCPERRKSRLTS